MKLLKGTLVAFSFILLSLGVHAQASVGIGLKGGLNFANINASQSAGANYNNRTGYHFGAYALIKLGKIGVQPELLYSKQGSSVTINSNNFDANYDYINVPVLIKLYTVAGINIQLGPQFGFATSTQLKSTTASVQSVNNAIKSSDISAAFGLGWDLPFGLSIDGRYNLGLSNNNNISGYSANLKNQVYMVSVGYRLFKLGK